MTLTLISCRRELYPETGLAPPLCGEVRLLAANARMVVLVQGVSAMIVRSHEKRKGWSAWGDWFN